MIEKENDCVGCETCVRCGRGDYKVVSCDICDTVIHPDDKRMHFNGKDICEACVNYIIEWQDTDLVKAEYWEE